MAGQANAAAGNNYFDGMTKLGKTHKHFLWIAAMCYFFDQMDMQLYTQDIKDYFRSKPNNRKLLKYGKVFGIEEKIRIYMEVL